MCYISIRVNRGVLLNTHTPTHTHSNTHTRQHTRTHIHTPTHTNTHTYTPTHTPTHTHTITHTNTYQHSHDQNQLSELKSMYADKFAKLEQDRNMLQSSLKSSTKVFSSNCEVKKDLADAQVTY